MSVVCAHAVVDAGATQDGGTYWDCKRCMGDPTESPVRTDFLLLSCDYRYDQI